LQRCHKSGSRSETGSEAQTEIRMLASDTYSDLDFDLELDHDPDTKLDLQVEIDPKQMWTPISARTPT